MIDIAKVGRYNNFEKAGVAQLVEYKLPKLGVAGSNPVARSIFILIENENAIQLKDTFLKTREGFLV